MSGSSTVSRSSSMTAAGPHRPQAAMTVAAPLRQTPGAAWPWTDEVLLLTGRDRAELMEQVRELQARLASAPEQEGVLTDLAYTFNCQKAWAPCRLALVAGTLEDLQLRLERTLTRLEKPNCKQIRDVSGIYFTEQPLAATGGKIAVLTPGEGAQYLGMLRELPDHFPALAACLERCDALSAKAQARPVSEFIRFGTDETLDNESALDEELKTLTGTMCSVLVADWLVLLLLEQLGINGHVAAGHSMGELAAICFGGGVEDETAGLELAGEMARTIAEQQETADNGDSLLLAVGASKERLEKLIAEGEAAGTLPADSVVVAMDNCPHQGVMVAKQEVASVVTGLLEAERLVFERLPFARPYHTDRFRPSLGPVEEFLARMPFKTPEKTIYSCTTARPFPANPDEIRRLAVEHWASPVAFTEMIKNMHADGVRVFVEAGPRGNLTAFVEDILRGQPMLAVPADNQRRSSLSQLNHLLGQLAVHGVPLDLTSLYLMREPQLFPGFVDVPLEEPAVESQVAEPAASSQEISPQELSPQEVPPPELPIPSDYPSETPMEPWSEDDLVVHEYLGVMQQFLATQQQVMTQYLQGTNLPEGASFDVPAQSYEPEQSTFDNSQPPAYDPFAQNAELADAGAADEFTAEEQSVVSSGINPDFPLVGDIVQHDPGQEIVVHRVFNLHEDLFAQDHTIGGRSVSQVDPNQHGLPVMPMTFTLEMMSEVSRLLVPGKVVVAIENVQLAKWLAYENAEHPITVEVTAKRMPQGTPTGGVKLSLTVKDLGPRSADGSFPEKPATAATATAVLEDTYPQPVPGTELQLSDERESRVSLHELYRSLFHGERLTGVEKITRYGQEGIEGIIATLARDNLFSSCPDPHFTNDPVLMDIMMHPLVAWHLEQPSQQGRISVPFGLQRVEFYGPPPAVGTSLLTRGWMQSETPRQFKHTVEVLNPDGSLLYRLNGGRYWRFYLPVAEVNFNGPKDQYFISEPWTSAMPSDAAAADLEISCVRLFPPEDVRDSAMRLPACRVTMSPREQADFHALEIPNPKKVDWLFGRIAAKDAVRLAWNQRHGERLFPADILIDHDEQGRPIASLRNGATPTDFPRVSLTHSHGIMAALAAIHSYVGIDLEKIEPRDEAFVKMAFDADEQALLKQCEDHGELAREDILTRFWTAKEAVGKALGQGLSQGPRSLSVVWTNRPGTLMGVRLGSALSELFPNLADRTLAVTVHREDGMLDHNMIVATTLCEPLHG